MPQKIKKLFLLLLLTELLFAYAPAFAQSPSPAYNSGVDKQIESYLCDPTATGSGVLYQCINQIYKFALVLASILGVLFIVIAGYVYMSAEGNSESVDKAKSILESTIVSLVILFGGFVLLNSINPDLVQFHGNTLQPVTITVPAGGAGGGVPPSGGGQCQTSTSGIASAGALQSTCFGSNASRASMIANKESAGNSTLPSGVDLCRDQSGKVIQINGQNVSASWGLFQINITAHAILTPSGTLPCPSAFSAMYTASNHICLVTNPTLYAQCVAAATDAKNNILTACGISNNGQNWGAWANECGF